MPRQAHPRKTSSRGYTIQYRDATSATRARTTSALSQLWLSLPNYRDDSIAAFADKGSRISAAGAITTATLTAAFVEIATRTISGDAQRPAPTSPASPTCAPELPRWRPTHAQASKSGT